MQVTPASPVLNPPSYDDFDGGRIEEEGFHHVHAGYSGIPGPKDWRKHIGGERLTLVEARCGPERAGESASCVRILVSNARPGKDPLALRAVPRSADVSTAWIAVI